MNTRHLATATLLLTATLANAEKPKGLADSDWSSIRAAYEAGRHQVHPQANDSAVALNPGQSWQLSFDTKGFFATPADDVWSWGLELESLNGRPARPGRPVISGHRVSYDRGEGLEEWFINDARGLEQGWTIRQRPESGNATLRLELGVRGTLKPVLSTASVSFVNAGGGVALTYGGLKAWDMKGRNLPVRFDQAGEGIAVEVNVADAVFPVTIDPVAQQAYLKGSQTSSNQEFGSAMAMSGNTVVIAAPGEAGAGAVYVFVRNGAGWAQQARLQGSNTESGDAFGRTVAMSGDTVVVGTSLEDSDARGVNRDGNNNNAVNSGAAYIFERRGTVWAQQAYLKASNSEGSDFFGGSVAVSGNTVIVGATGESSAATGVNGNQASNTASRSGAVYVFGRSGSSWQQQAYLKASNTGPLDGFGSGVAINGNTVVVGANNEDSNASGIDGDQENNLLGESGAAYVFIGNGSSWFQQAYLKASNPGGADEFGSRVALSGDVLVVAATREASDAVGINGNGNNNLASSSGAAYVFARNGGTWSQQAFLKASNAASFDFFGTSIAVAGETVVIGAFREDSNATGIDGNQANNSISESGAAYVFVRRGTVWFQERYLKASNTGENDLFGSSVAVDADTVVVGAYGERSNATGVNGNQSDNSTANAGAAYVFYLGELLASLGKTGHSLPGTDLAFGAAGFGALSPTGQTLFEGRLLGSGSTRGRTAAMLSTLTGTVDIALQKDSFVPGLLGLPTGAKIATVTNALHNRDVSAALFQATVKGKGLNGTNNRLLFLDNGIAIAPLSRTGAAVAELSGAVPSAYREVLQREGAADQIALGYTLKRGGVVNPGNDSGLLLMSHDGSLISFNAQEGNAAFSPPGGISPGALGQFNRTAVSDGSDVFFTAKFIPSGAKPLDALFHVGGSSGRNIPLQGDPAGGTTLGESYRVFTGLTRIGSLGLLRATLTGGPASGNEGVWNSGGGLLLRKGQDIGSGLVVKKILRVWGINNGQMVVQVILGGTGVNGSNNQALILRQGVDDFFILLRTGQPAPGIGFNQVTVAKIQAIDVDPVNGHYAVLGSLKGAAKTANQALWSGQITLVGDLRLPRLRLQKSERYHTESTYGELIRSIALKPVVDPSGVGARGFAQQINSAGQILLTLTGDRKAQEIVRLSP